MKWLVGVIVLSIVGLLLFVAAFRDREPPSKPNASSSDRTTSVPREPKQYTVLLDVSASRTTRMIDQGKAFVDSLVDGMNYGDRLFMSQMYEAGVTDPESALDVTITKSNEITSLEEQDALKADKKMLKSKVDLFFDEAQKKPIMETDIFSTLSIASEQMPDSKHNVLVVLSDMLQSSREFEFAHLRRMPPHGWIEERVNEHLVRPLHAACVVVVGADPSTAEGVSVREFWQNYFLASGASLTKGYYGTTPPPETVCE